jgi:predicted tellurium resistance membrane protein TerC
MLVLFALLIIGVLPICWFVRSSGRIAASRRETAIVAHRRTVNLLMMTIAMAVIVIVIFIDTHPAAHDSLNQTVDRIHHILVIYLWLPLFVGTRVWFTGTRHPRVHHWFAYSSFGLLFASLISGGILWWQLVERYGIFA